jgi:hypothetical protein
LRASVAKRAVLVDNLARAIATLVDHYVGRPAGDSRLRLGGARGQRGRLELRRDTASPEDPGSRSDGGEIVGART